MSLRLSSHTFTSHAVETEVEYRLLLPEDHRDGERLPLVLHFHGAMSSSASLELALPLYREEFDAGEFPRAIVACPSTPTQGGFYLDQEDGAAWETMVGTELPAHLEKTVGTFDRVALLGASMGGYGALKQAFADPERFTAVAAISPAVFPGESPADVPARNIPSVLGELHRTMAPGGDARSYARNSVHGRARSRDELIRSSELSVLIDCGAADEFLLHEGAAYLHEVLTELDIEHTFRLVEGAGHVGPAAERRTLEAIRFLGRALMSR
ncbi:alpha/beta hydrolase [Nocardiopsis alba]|uniref:alpha/beta hydrolase n=1 Tax=Nocardiopsis alba TaxID=53437 RepID=UPI00366F8F9E